ncbi:MAG: phosphatidylinositol-3,5-bisphosphate 5-phosphatase [Piccolia ochrophora]|nr:MAG: phosphatidylinositol-3,5-bisphosphate 5-phosphatase [Piccolia ochrophora]
MEDTATARRDHDDAREGQQLPSQGSSPSAATTSVSQSKPRSSSTPASSPPAAALNKDGEPEMHTTDPVKKAKAAGYNDVSAVQPQIDQDPTTRFPQLSHHPPVSPDGPRLPPPANGEDEEPATAKSFERSASPTTNLLRNRSAAYEKVGDDGICKMQRFSLYETASRYYLVGGDLLDRRFRVLKIDRTADSGDLSIAGDDIVYTKKEMNQVLNAIDDGNRSSGGMKLRCSAWGLLGFIRFTGAYYMLLITKRSQVALIGGHYIYQVDGTELIPLTVPSSSRFKMDRNPEEARFLGILHNLDLSRSFYFSYSYDITRTLQHNMTRERRAMSDAIPPSDQNDFNAMFVWNHYLLEPAEAAIKYTFDWCRPVVHGYVDQATLSVYGRTVYITILARRSRFFAGARFLKRGANDLGYVANDVETEQIVSEMLTTSFHAPGPRMFANPNYTSYVQHRGSIPLYWTQDNTGVTPKPPIELNLVDPFYSAAALHFDNLFARYGAPIYVLNLVKARERTPRESKLLKEFTNAIEYLNQFLPKESKIIYNAWDMSRASKSRDQDVIGTLEDIAEDVVRKTGFFRNGDDDSIPTTLQNGVARTNCIDCLDRTNAAQFVIGKRALSHQLFALGVIGDTSVEYDTDAVNLFTHMYHDHGDTIAVQYGGSHLVNTMETYRKINQWTSHSRDMVESFKRYYNNSFLDGQRQEAYNLFLGNYIFAQGQPMLWDLASDYYLHHSDPRAWSNKSRRNYIHWFTPENLKQRERPPPAEDLPHLTEKPLEFFDDYWPEYYRPLAVSSFMKIFSFRMNSTLRYLPFKSTQEGKHDLSPFRVRTAGDQDTTERRRNRKGVTLADPCDDNSDDAASIISHSTTTSKRTEKYKWLPFQTIDKPSPAQSETKPQTSHHIPHSSVDGVPTASRTPSSQWTLDEFVHNSLRPSVTSAEAVEYERYVNHPLNLPLVVSVATPANASRDFVRYVNNVTPAAVAGMTATTDDISQYESFLDVGDAPLAVGEGDGSKKRYKAYRQWLKGKSLFKQQRLEP